jgi:vacuolar protein 8
VRALTPWEDENRALLVQAGAVPVLVALLLSPDPDIQYYCTTAISNIAVDPTNRERLAQTERGLVSGLVRLMAGDAELVAGQAALASRNLASDGSIPPNNLVLFFFVMFGGLTLDSELST